MRIGCYHFLHHILYVIIFKVIICDKLSFLSPIWCYNFSSYPIYSLFSFFMLSFLCYNFQGLIYTLWFFFDSVMLSFCVIIFMLLLCYHLCYNFLSYFFVITSPLFSFPANVTHSLKTWFLAFLNILELLPRPVDRTDWAPAQNQLIGCCTKSVLAKNDIQKSYDQVKDVHTSFIRNNTFSSQNMISLDI
jgi:hypothetical protein